MTDLSARARARLRLFSLHVLVLAICAVPVGHGSSTEQRLIDPPNLTEVEAGWAETARQIDRLDAEASQSSDPRQALDLHRSIQQLKIEREIEMYRAQLVDAERAGDITRADRLREVLAGWERIGDRPEPAAVPKAGEADR
jgi:hypothetical protein